VKKKTLLLLGLAWVALLGGCRNEYFAEKEFYKASKVLNAVEKTVDTQATVTPSIYEPAIKAFERVAEKFPGSNKAVESLFQIARLRVEQKDYEKARDALGKVVQNSNGTIGSKAAEARFRIAQLYEMEGNWSAAEKAYWETAEYHSLQANGLYAPVYVLLHYKKAKDVTGERGAFIKAKEHYESVLKTVGPIQASASIRHYLAVTHLIHGDWRKARDEWLGIARDLPTHPGAPLAIVAAADVVTENGNLEKGIALYRRYLRQYPHDTLKGKVLVRMGLLEGRRARYDRARLWLERAMSLYMMNKEKTAVAELKLFIGQSYEKEGKWTEADTLYQEVEREHPVTLAALQIPLIRYEHYRAAGEGEKSRSSMDDAINTYKNLIKQYPRTNFGRQALRFLQTAYIKKGDWVQLLSLIDVETAQERNTYKQGQWLLLKAVITERRLQDKDKALALYRDFLIRFPNHPLVETAKQRQQILTQN